MSSVRHTSDEILDAARDCVLAVGFRRTTLTDVARRAGLSRMTLYRRYPDVRTLVADLMTREFGALLGRVAKVSAGLADPATPSQHAPAAESERVIPISDTRSVLVSHTVAAVRALRANPLLRKVLDVDPELVLPYVIDRLGSTQLYAEAFFAEQLRKGHTDGSVRRGDPLVQARTLLLTTQSHVLSYGPASAGLPPDAPDAPDALDAELAHLLSAYLAPGEP